MNTSRPSSSLAHQNLTAEQPLKILSPNSKLYLINIAAMSKHKEFSEPEPNNLLASPSAEYKVGAVNAIQNSYTI
jgi:hypothetical protein